MKFCIDIPDTYDTMSPEDLIDAIGGMKFGGLHGGSSNPPSSPAGGSEKPSDTGKPNPPTELVVEESVTTPTPISVGIDSDTTLYVVIMLALAAMVIWKRRL